MHLSLCPSEVLHQVFSKDWCFDCTRSLDDLHPSFKVQSRPLPTSERELKIPTARTHSSSIDFGEYRHLSFSAIRHLISIGQDHVDRTGWRILNILFYVLNIMRCWLDDDFWRQGKFWSNYICHLCLSNSSQTKFRRTLFGAFQRSSPPPFCCTQSNIVIKLIAALITRFACVCPVCRSLIRLIRLQIPRYGHQQTFQPLRTISPTHARYRSLCSSMGRTKWNDETFVSIFQKPPVFPHCPHRTPATLKCK